MKRLWFAAAASGLALGALATSPAQAAARVLTFDENACAYSGSGCPILPTYGDTPQVDVSYRAYRAADGETVHGHLRWWSAYGDLRGVVFGGSNSTGYVSEIKLTAASGYQLSLLDFDLATFAGRSASTPVAILDLAGNLLTSFTADTAWPNHGHANVNTRYVDGVMLRWGPDGYEVGLDNIRFDVRSVSSAVPEPGVWAMMILGTGCVGAALRRRRALRPMAA